MTFRLLLLLFLLFLTKQQQGAVLQVTFLITVNDTWYPESFGRKCIATVKTPPQKPGQPRNDTNTIQIGECDHGPMTYQVDKSGMISLTFYSSVIEDASSPSCDIAWNYSYVTPKHPGLKESPLPGCWTAESREGFHMTYYWFYVLDWVMG